MRRTRRLVPLAATILLAGCSDVIAPSAQDIASPATLTRAAGSQRHLAEPARQEFVVQLDHTVPVACAGEDVRFSGPVVYWVHWTTGPSGTRMLHVTVPTSAAPGPFRGVGQRSGKVWTLERGTSTQTIVWTKAGKRIVNFTRHETYVSAAREVMRLQHDMHVAIEDGRMTGVNDSSWSCR